MPFLLLDPEINEKGERDSRREKRERDNDRGEREGF